MGNVTEIPPGTYTVETCPGHLAKATGNYRHLHHGARLCFGAYSVHEGEQWIEHPPVPVLDLSGSVALLRTTAEALDTMRKQAQVLRDGLQELAQILEGVET